MSISYNSVYKKVKLEIAKGKFKRKRDPLQFQSRYWKGSERL